MKLCKVCSIPMETIMSFSKEKYEKFCRCPKCYGETRHQRIKDSELCFGERDNKKYKQ